MKKYFFAFVSIFAATISVIAFQFVNVKYPQNDIMPIVNDKQYEETAEFYDTINSHLSSIFKYINLKSTFEKNDQFNYGMIIANTLDANGVLKSWTLQDILDLSAKHGVYIDNNYNVTALPDNNSVPFNKNTYYNFLLKTYPAKNRTGAMTEENYVYEVMRLLATYYKTKNMLDTGNTNFYYKVIFTSKNNDSIIEYSNTDISPNEFLNKKSYILISNKDRLMASNISMLDKAALRDANNNNPYPNMNFIIYCYVDTSYQKNDIFAISRNEYDKVKSNIGMLLTCLFTSVIIFIFSLLLTIYFILSTKKTIEPSTSIFYRIPTEIYLIVYVAVTAYLYSAIDKIATFDLFNTINTPNFKVYFYILITYTTTILMLTALTSKYSNDTLKPFLISNFSSENNSNLKTAKCIFVIIFFFVLIFTLISIYMIYLYTVTYTTKFIVIAVTLLFSTIVFIVCIIYMYNAFNLSLNEQKNSNDMRVSLITNVTHDIKTPLTSIINYTDLISNEISHPTKSTNKNLKHFSEIITEKSHRLNDLINDLIFDSKVSSGNIETKMEKVELVSFLNQVHSEFIDKLKEQSLKVITESFSKEVYIEADSKHLYRIFQNLYSNFLKYALPNTRIYVDIENVKSRIYVKIKNIQKEKLQVDVKDLKDRFVRGNTSRTTEGFGLGLSITESLIKLMNGKFEIKVVKDEFITIITFLKYEE